MNIPQDFIWPVLTVYLESRDQPDFGERTVLKSILNRAKNKSWPLKNIVLARKQFSCWNAGVDHPSNHIREISTFVNTWNNCLVALDEWQKGDTFHGVTHYYSPKAMIPKYSAPYWVNAKNMVFIDQVDDHRFYREG